MKKNDSGHKHNGQICPKCNRIHPDRTGRNNIVNTQLEVRNKISRTLTGHKHTEETKAKMHHPKSEQGRKNIGNAIKRDYDSGKRIPGMLNKHHTEDWKIKNGQKLKEKYQNGYVSKLTGISKKKEVVQRMIQTWKDKVKSGRISPLKNKTWEQIYGIEEAKKLKQERSISQKKSYVINTNRKAKAIIHAKQRWQNPEYKEKQIKLCIAGLIKRPTSFESKIIFLIQKYQLSYTYTGDGKVILDGLNPDFVNNNGEKIVIETYYSYFKNKVCGSVDNYKEQRIKRLGKLGFKIIFLDENDICRDDWEEHCLNKINKFGGDK